MVDVEGETEFRAGLISPTHVTPAGGFADELASSGVPPFLDGTMELHCTPEDMLTDQTELRGSSMQS